MDILLSVLLILSAIFSSALADICSCGIEQVNTRIIKGHEAKRGRYPWLVSLLIKKESGSYSSCGGSIINDRYILTAAHCVWDTDPSDVIAMVGAHKSSERMRAGAGQMKLKIESIKVHEKYDNQGRKMNDDIALMKLASPVTFDNTFMPICLADFSQHDNLFVYGWGRQDKTIGFLIRRSHLTSSEVLHEVQVDEVDNSTCTDRYWSKTFSPAKEICAGTEAGSCLGDSGGPLSTRSRGNVYQVGVVSFGTSDCGVQGTMKPDIYERVTAHMHWIQHNTRGAKWCSGSRSPSFTQENLADTGKSFKSTSQPSIHGAFKNL